MMTPLKDHAMGDKGIRWNEQGRNKQRCAQRASGETHGAGRSMTTRTRRNPHKEDRGLTGIAEEKFRRYEKSKKREEGSWSESW